MANTLTKLQNVLEEIKTEPDSRRMIVSGWNVSDIQELIRGKRSAPPLYHTLFQFNVANGKLHCQLYQRAQIFSLVFRLTLLHASSHFL